MRPFGMGDEGPVPLPDFPEKTAPDEKGGSLLQGLSKEQLKQLLSELLEQL
jgi:hypothetical protein